MGQQQQFLKIMLFAFETGFNCGQLTVVTDPFFLETFDDLFVGLLNGLCLVVLDHNLVKTILEHADGPHHGVLLDVAKFAVLDLLQLVLQGEQHILLHLGLVLLPVQQNAQVVLIGDSEAQFAFGTG
jgi:hypothetical protein